MNKQILIIYEYDILYDILFELKNFLSFKIQKVSKKDLKTSIADQNNLVVSKKDLNLDNQFKINHIPIELNKLIDQLNVGFLQKKIALQKNIKVGNYYINFNSRKISDGNKSISVTEKETAIINFLHNSKRNITILELQSEVWGHKSKLETHTVETHVYRLRKKFQKQFQDDNFIKSSKKGYYIS